MNEILAQLPEVIERLALLEQQGSTKLLGSLKGLCGEWTIFARYSPMQADMDDACAFLKQVRDVKSWLR